MITGHAERSAMRAKDLSAALRVDDEFNTYSGLME